MKRPGRIEHKKKPKHHQIPVSLQLPFHLKKKANLLESSYWKKEFKNLLLGKSSANKKSTTSNRKSHQEYYFKQKFSSSVRRGKKDSKPNLHKHSQKGDHKIKALRDELATRKLSKNRKMGKRQPRAEPVAGARDLRLAKLSKIRSAAELLIPEERKGIKISLKLKEVNSTKESNQALLSSFNRKKRLMMESTIAVGNPKGSISLVNSHSKKKNLRSKVSLFSKKEKSTQRVFQAKSKPASENEHLLSFFKYNSRLFMGKSEKDLKKSFKENANLSNIREKHVKSGQLTHSGALHKRHSTKVLKLNSQSTKNVLRHPEASKAKANRRAAKQCAKSPEPTPLQRTGLKKRSQGERSRGQKKPRGKKRLMRSSMKKKAGSMKKNSVQYMIDQAINRNFRKKLKKKAGQERRETRLERKYPLSTVKKSIEKFFISNKHMQNCRDIRLFPRIQQIKIKNKIQFSRQKLRQTHKIFVLDKTRAKRASRKSLFKSVKKSHSKAKRFKKFGTFTKRRKRVFMKSQSIRRISGKVKSVSRRSIWVRMGRGEGAQLKFRTNSFSLGRAGRRGSSRHEQKSILKRELKRFQRALHEGDQSYMQTQLAQLVEKIKGSEPDIMSGEFMSRYQSKNQGNFNDFFDYRAVEFCQRIMDFWYIKSKNMVKEIFSYLKEELFLQSIKRDIERICYWVVRMLEDKCTVIRRMPTTESRRPEESQETLSSMSVESIGELIKKEFQVEVFFDSDNKKEKEKKNILVRSAEFVGIFEEHPDKYIFDNLKVA